MVLDFMHTEVFCDLMVVVFIKTIFGADMSSSMNFADKNKYILILDKGPTYGLDDTMLTAKKYSEISKAPFMFRHWFKKFFN